MSAHEWIKVAEAKEFEDVDRKLVQVEPVGEVGLFKVDGAFYALSAWCSHQKASLFNGDIVGHEIMCPLHGARFDLRTGQNLSLPAVRPVASYPTRLENGELFIQTGPA
jgi:nitrite reductase/ring-hydroxylating ferredoxin subunit